MNKKQSKETKYKQNISYQHKHTLIQIQKNKKKTTRTYIKSVYILKLQTKLNKKQTNWEMMIDFMNSN